MLLRNTLSKYKTFARNFSLSHCKMSLEASKKIAAIRAVDEHVKNNKLPQFVGIGSGK